MALRKHSLRQLYFVVATLIALSLFVTIPRAQDPPNEELDVVTVNTNLVTLNVSVTKDRRPISNLQIEDFCITDQGLPVTPQFFEAQAPTSIVFVIDTSSSMRGTNWDNLKSGIKEFLSKERENNNYTLVTFNERPTVLLTAASKEAFWTTFKKIKPDGETALYDGLLAGLQLLNKLPSKHKAIVLLSDGDDNRSSTTLSQIQEEIYRHHANLYPIGIHLDKGIDRLSSKPTFGKTILTNLALSTGGTVLFPAPSQIDRALTSISDQISAEYTLSYYPPDQTSGWRSVQVDLAQVRHRRRGVLRYQSKYLLKANSD